MHSSLTRRTRSAAANVMKVKDIATGRAHADTVENVEPNFVWADDNRTIFYIEKDPVTLLSKRLKAHVLGTPASEDRLVYEEKDDSFYMGIGRTSADKYICISVQSTVSNEQRCTPASNPGEWRVLAPRERDFRYNADHIGNRWVIRTTYVARLRAMKTDDNPLVYRVQMEAGHGGKSGRFEQFRSRAEYYAFMLDQLGVE